jgi:hypothetical protein
MKNSYRRDSDKSSAYLGPYTYVQLRKEYRYCGAVQIVRGDSV